MFGGGGGGNGTDRGERRGGWREGGKEGGNWRGAEILHLIEPRTEDPSLSFPPIQPKNSPIARPPQKSSVINSRRIWRNAFNFTPDVQGMRPSKIMGMVTRGR